jgi:hypothetical protein
MSMSPWYDLGERVSWKLSSNCEPSISLPNRDSLVPRNSSTPGCDEGSEARERVGMTVDMPPGVVGVTGALMDQERRGEAWESGFP